MHYSKSTGSFYDTAIHGTRQILIDNPAWVRPTKEIADPNWKHPMIAVPDTSAEVAEGEEIPLKVIPDPKAVCPMITVPDETAVPDQILVDNPDCKLPEDAVEITKELHTQLFEDQAAGKTITADKDGFPIAIDTPAVKGNALVEHQVRELERSISILDIAEAIVSGDKTALTDKLGKIAALRKKLK